MRIVFIGTGAIGVATLRALLHAPEHEVIGVVTQPDKPVGRRQHTEAPPIKAELAKQSLPILQPRRLRDEESVAQIRELAPELIVVMAYGQILPESVLQIASIACLNVHASLLPKYRGAAPIQSAIAAGDTETGITIMYMDAGLDTGDILLQEKLTILPNETGGSLHDRLAQIAPDTLLNALAQLVNGHAAREPQDSARATYAAKLTRDDGKIDWAKNPCLRSVARRFYNARRRLRPPAPPENISRLGRRAKRRSTRFCFDAKRKRISGRDRARRVAPRRSATGRQASFAGC
jgi:methionyl-tRNA formyltransferase